MDTQRLSECKKRFKTLMEIQEKWAPKWKEVSRLILPERGFYDGDDIDEAKAPDYRKIIDDTATSAAGILMAGLMSGLTPQNKQWFKLELRNNPLSKNKQVRMWLDYVEGAMLEVFNGSNVYEALPHIYEEAGTFGTAAAAILEDPFQMIRINVSTVGEYALGVDNYGTVNAFARSFILTVSQVVEQFGLENCSAFIRGRYKNNNLDEKVKVYNLVAPSYRGIRNFSIDGEKPFVSFYWTDEVNEAHPGGFLYVGGFDEFPFMTPRWKTTTMRSCYGIGCGMRAIGNVRSLQKLQESGHLGVEKAVNPPVHINAQNAHAAKIDLAAGGRSYIPVSGSSFGIKTAYDVAIDLSGVQAYIADTRQRINRCFNADLFLMVAGQNKQMTAKEVAALQAEQLLQLGPVLQKMTAEGTTILINRTFNIMLKNNALPPVPQELEGVDIEVEYRGMLAQAQKAAETNALGESLTWVGNIIQMNPESADVINWDFGVRRIFDNAGLPAEMLRSEGEVAKVRQERAQAQAAAAEQEQAAQMAQNAKTLSQADLEGDNALARMSAQEGESGGAPA